MATLGKDWAYVKGNWDPTLGGQALTHNSNELNNRVSNLQDRIRSRHKRKANYTEIGRTKQTDDEDFEAYRIRMTEVFKLHSGLQPSEDLLAPYNQQLKNALHAGALPRIRTWVEKHFVDLPGSTLQQYNSNTIQ